MTCFGPGNWSGCSEYECSGLGFMPTRDICILPQELPFQNRAFDQQTNIPQMFCGGPEGYGMQTSIETGLRELSSRDPRSCTVYEYRDYGNMMPLICNWQQPDFRPLFFAEDTRNYIKDIGRSKSAIYDQCTYYDSKGIPSYTPYYGVIPPDPNTLGYVVSNTLV
jgi:hypothetical protein